MEIGVLPDPALLYLPLATYQGDMDVVVDAGQSVTMYQLVAASSGTFAATIHAPVSGEVLGVTEIAAERYLTIKNDFCYTEKALTVPDTAAWTSEDFLQYLLYAGIEGSGGARFPTHLKYRVAPSTIKTFIINGAECEPYLSADYILMKTAGAKLMAVLQIIQRMLMPDEIVLAIEQQHKELAVPLAQMAKQFGLDIALKILPNTYPQGGELQLIKSVTGIEIAKGSIPAHHGMIVSNVGTLWAMAGAFLEGKPYTERIITVSGNRSRTLGNYRVKIGTPLGHILRETQHEWNQQAQTVILGGPMMGRAAVSPLQPIHKGVGGLLLLENADPQQMNCIACGYCVDACPQHLMPLEFVRHNQEEDLHQLKAFHLEDCIACGACAYVCPSDVPLMYHIQVGKEKLRQERSDTSV
ncbi:electron transport complex subunit RsxC [Sphingobacterium oryzagri]|uniref:Ion-translocating oxidoreductase complex subunit C n=1 Tax=Sphingobacterium oryzagri TaxID=3025669 RepID=A0ABY7WNM8_9SPHI|nr:electron transport complex subunit RsxC [Sphingobacterium sp. KACC 22765]WDF70016.1 electron transport complex subunit RsxC [Sphingobacterium sp. KACC 22765]